MLVTINTSNILFNIKSILRSKIVIGLTIVIVILTVIRVVDLAFITGKSIEPNYTYRKIPTIVQAQGSSRTVSYYANYKKGVKSDNNLLMSEILSAIIGNKQGVYRLNSSEVLNDLKMLQDNYLRIRSNAPGQSLKYIYSYSENPSIGVNVWYNEGGVYIEVGAI